jgi:hypothetical protein
LQQNRCNSLGNVLGKAFFGEATILNMILRIIFIGVFLMDNKILFSVVYLISVLAASVSQIILKKSADNKYASKIKEYIIAFPLEII